MLLFLPFQPADDEKIGTGTHFLEIDSPNFVCHSDTKMNLEIEVEPVEGEIVPSRKGRAMKRLHETSPVDIFSRYRYPTVNCPSLPFLETGR